MTLVALPGNNWITWPNYLGICTAQAALSGNATTIDAAGEYECVIFQADQDMTISHVGFLPGTSTGSPTLEVRVETVDASGLPSGTLWAANTNATTATLVTTTWELTALTASASVTRGQWVAVRWVYASGTSTASRTVASCGAPRTNTAYRVVNTGTPTITAFTTAALCAAIGSSSTTFYFIPGLIPHTGNPSGAFNNTNSAARGLRFQVPFKCRVRGLYNYFNSTNGDFNAVVYDDSGNELSNSSTAFDGDYTGDSVANPTFCFFDNPVTLSINTWYRIAIEPTTATNTNVHRQQTPSSDYISATPWGANAHYTTRSSGTWTDTATNELAFMGLIIDQLDDGASAGGSGGSFTFA